MSYRSALSASFPGGSLPKINFLHNHLGDNTSDAGTPIERCRRPTIAWPSSTTTAASTPTAAAAAAAAATAGHFQSSDAAVVIAEETDEQQQQQQQQQQLTEPLLLPASPVKEVGVVVDGVQQRWGSGLWFELRMVLLLALPTVITSAAQQVIIITSQVITLPVRVQYLTTVPHLHLACLVWTRAQIDIT
jgi:hypothetical protein